MGVINDENHYNKIPLWGPYTVVRAEKSWLAQHSGQMRGMHAGVNAGWLRANFSHRISKRK